jgi:mRNA interferase RelE/StbE
VNYRVQIAAGAVREIRKLPKEAARQALEAIAHLADNPRPSEAKKLEGISDGYRVRMGVYRIVYTIEDDILKVHVLTVGHRREVYKGLQARIKHRIS